MRTARAKTAAQREPRRWRTPPPLIRGSESLEGMDILREVGGETGVLLWQSYRNVMFWATAEPEQRASLFSAEAGRKRLAEVAAARIPQDLAEPLAAIAGLLTAPDTTPGEVVAGACSAIAQWAEEERNGAAALSFTQAAALALPRSAALALKVGQVARERGENARGETWFRHAIMISRQVGDWDTYARAYLALGNMAVKRGSFPVAHRMHIKALRAARRKGIPALQGRAAHDLFVVALETGRHTQAEEYAKMAFRAYGPTDSRVPMLAHDVAYLWMEQGYFARALPVFEAVRPHFTLLTERLSLVANIARAAGGTGDREVFRKAWVEASRLAKDPEARSAIPGSMLDLAQGAASLGEWDRAEQAAEQALTAARDQRQAKVMFSAETLLDSIRNGRKIEGVQVQPSESASHDADQFAATMVRTLEMATAR
ncbi:MAG TPA: tetratricopeptide repeat protein [Longimicrobium sp.]|jgi:tetratricopeptide (TPR) repeat protein